MTNNHMRGTVRWFNVKRGYGFLSDENGVDYFVHYSEITGEGFKKLSAGEAVEFLVSEDGQGRTIARGVLALGRAAQEISRDKGEETEDAEEDMIEDATEENDI